MNALDARTLIPQRDPFVLVDELLDADTTRIRTSFRVPAEHVLFDGRNLREGALLENMAQSIAAGQGFLARQQGSDVSKGFIGAIKKIHIERLPEAGELLHTEAEMLHEIGDARIAAARVFSGDRLLASAEFTIFVSS
ncbi:MAG TPA: hypothetical protein PLP34_07285 [Chitinophagaceae bacterium]|nr:hypothetical protein [Chitinophagaceae bacterium]